MKTTPTTSEGKRLPDWIAILLKVLELILNFVKNGKPSDTKQKINNKTNV